MTLGEAAALLGVHYMTAYRYVRTGRLDATQAGNRWLVARASVLTLRRGAATARRRSRGSRGSRRAPRAYAARLADRLVAGDERASWQLVQDALTAAYTPEQLYLDVLSPALRAIGDRWADGTTTVAEEHRASAVAQRLVGRLGPAFSRPGPSKGTIVLGAPSGDHHSLPSALVADPLRGRGFTIADLGAHVPPQSFADAIQRVARLRAVGIVVSNPVPARVVRETVDAVRASTDAPLLVGGCALTGSVASAARHASAFSDSAATAITWFCDGRSPGAVPRA